jgi:hypothetical protein
MPPRLLYSDPFGARSGHDNLMCMDGRMIWRCTMGEHTSARSRLWPAQSSEECSQHLLLRHVERWLLRRNGRVRGSRVGGIRGARRARRTGRTWVHGRTCWLAERDVASPISRRRRLARARIHHRQVTGRARRGMDILGRRVACTGHHGRRPLRELMKGVRRKRSVRERAARSL